MFIDLTRFWVQSQRVDAAEVADTLDAYYEQVGAFVKAAGGREDKRHDVAGKTVNVAPEREVRPC